MRISIIGSGYVGLTTGLALCELGNQLVLVDKQEDKLARIRSARAPFYEPKVDDLLRKHIVAGSVRATSDTEDAVMETQITFIAVGTPMAKDGSMETSFVRSAAMEIGEAIGKKRGDHLVVVKSTVVPGTTRDLIVPVLEGSSGLKAGKDFGVAMCPEFLREGSAMHDSMNPDRVVIGCQDDRTYEALQGLFAPLGSRFLRTDTTTAEMIKYSSNSFLATKIAFANEISRICERLGIDVYDVMKGVGMDSRISPQFLRAGIGFGGSCFPKDVSALIKAASDLGVRTPILSSVMETNDIQPNHMADVMENKLGSLKGLRIAILGLAFKPDTDDVRETRAIPLAMALSDRGAIIGGHDPKAFDNFREAFPDIERFHRAEEAVGWADAVVLMTEWPEYGSIKWSGRQNLRGIFDGRRTIDAAGCGTVPYWAMGTPLDEGR